MILGIMWIIVGILNMYCSYKWFEMGRVWMSAAYILISILAFVISTTHFYIQ